MEISEIVAWVLTVGLSFLGAAWKLKLNKVINVGKELADVIFSIVDAKRDEKFTKEEIEKIEKEINEFLKAAGIK